jgi:imidazolonepropionase-like amidohydrolase
MTSPEPFTISDVRPVTGGRVLAATHVRVESGVIAAVGDASVGRPGDVEVDGGGGVLLPGLIDSHVHLLPGCARLAAVFGVTTVIDMFSKPEVIDPERALVIAGQRGDAAAAADVRTSSVGATAPGGHPSLAYSPFPCVTGPHDAESFVADRLAEGADHLKVIYDDGSGVMLGIPALDVATIEALVGAAHRAGLVVVAHVSTASGAATVVRAGVDVLAHVPMDPLSAAQVREIAEAGVAVIATLGIIDGFPGPDGTMPLLGDPLLAERLPARWRRVVEGQATRWMPPHAPDGRVQRENVAALHAAGVPVLAGTDAPNPGLVHGASLHRELAHLVAAGLSPLAALAAATSVPARVFALPDRGVLEVGARADLLLVSGDPTVDIADSASIAEVWLRGRRVENTYAGSDVERGGIAWLRDCTAKIMRGIKDTWPDLPAPEDVLGEDGELLGRVTPRAHGWQPTTVSGAVLGEVTDYDQAVAIVRGSSSQPPMSERRTE